MSAPAGRDAWRVPDELDLVAARFGLSADDFAATVLPDLRTVPIGSGGRYRFELLPQAELDRYLAGDVAAVEQDACSTVELARRFGVSRDFVDHVLVPAGLPRVKLGNRVLHPLPAAARWLEQQAARQLAQQQVEQQRRRP